MVSKRSVLNSLSLSDLKRIAKALHIDLTPSLFELPQSKIMGEKRFVVDKLAKFRGVKLEDIDEVLGTNYSKKANKQKKVHKSMEKMEVEDEEEELEEIDILWIFLDKCFYKEDLQDILYNLELPVSGNKDDLIERIIESEMIDIPALLDFMDKDGLIFVCDNFDLKTKGTKAELKERILESLGLEEEEETEEELISTKETKPSQIRQISSPKREPVDYPPPRVEPVTPQPSQVDIYDEFSQVIDDIYQWIPRIRHSTEEGYRSDLADFLHYKMGCLIRQESGETKADIMVNNRVPIELKKNPTQSGYDRLFGQMVRHHRAKNCVIAVICDVRRLEQFEDFKHNAESFFRDDRDFAVIQK